MGKFGLLVCVAALAAAPAYAADVKPSSVAAPKDTATGLAAGKRMHKPYVITKDFSNEAAGRKFCADGKGEFAYTAGKFACTVDLDTAEGAAAAKSAGYDLKAAKGA